MLRQHCVVRRAVFGEFSSAAASLFTGHGTVYLLNPNRWLMSIILRLPKMSKLLWHHQRKVAGMLRIMENPLEEVGASEGAHFEGDHIDVALK